SGADAARESSTYRDADAAPDSTRRGADAAPDSSGKPVVDAAPDSPTSCRNLKTAPECAACCASTFNVGCRSLELVGYDCTQGCLEVVDHLCRGEAESDLNVNCLKSALTTVCPNDSSYVQHCNGASDCLSFVGCINACPK